MNRQDTPNFMPVLQSIKDTQLDGSCAASRELFSLIAELLTMPLTADERELLGDIILCFLKQSERSVSEVLLQTLLAKACMPLRVAFYARSRVC